MNIDYESQELKKLYNHYYTLANQRVPWAQSWIAEAYYWGWSVPRDFDKFVEWDTRAARNGLLFSAKRMFLYYYSIGALEAAATLCCKRFQGEDWGSVFPYLRYFPNVQECIDYFDNRDILSVIDYCSGLTDDELNDSQIREKQKSALLLKAMCFAYGLGVKKDFSQAMQCLKDMEALYDDDTRSFAMQEMWHIYSCLIESGCQQYENIEHDLYRFINNGENIIYPILNESSMDAFKVRHYMRFAFEGRYECADELGYKMLEFHNTRDNKHRRVLYFSDASALIFLKMAAGIDPNSKSTWTALKYTSDPALKTFDYEYAKELCFKTDASVDVSDSKKNPKTIRMWLALAYANLAQYETNPSIKRSYGEKGLIQCYKYQQEYILEYPDDVDRSDLPYELGLLYFYAFEEYDCALYYLSINRGGADEIRNRCLTECKKRKAKVTDDTISRINRRIDTFNQSGWKPNVNDSVDCTSDSNVAYSEDKNNSINREEDEAQTEPSVEGAILSNPDNSMNQNEQVAVLGGNDDASYQSDNNNQIDTKDLNSNNTDNAASEALERTGFVLEKDLKYNFEKQLKKSKDGQPYSAAYVADCYMRGIGVDKNTDEALKAILQAALLGDARCAIIAFFIGLNSNDPETAIKYLKLCISKEFNNHCYATLGVKRLLSLMESNPTLTAEGVFNALDEENDEYLVALCYLYAMGCDQDVEKASRVILQQAQIQLQNNHEIGMLAIFYQSVILLWQCFIAVDKSTDIANQLEEFLKRVSFCGDYSLTFETPEDDEDYTGPNMRAGYYEYGLMIGSAAGSKWCKKELCRLYIIDLENSTEISYPNYSDIWEEMDSLSENEDYVRNVLVCFGHHGTSEMRLKAASQLISTGYLADGYCAFASLYEGNDDYINALKYLRLWSDLNKYDYEEQTAYLSSAIPQKIIGSYYYDGTGVKKNTEKAVEWWQKAAQNGNSKAQELIDEITQMGNGDLKAGIEALRLENGETPVPSTAPVPTSNRTALQAQPKPVVQPYSNNRVPQQNAPQQNTYQQNAPQQNTYQQNAPQKVGNGFAIASLVTGIVGVFCCIPCSISAVVLSIISMKKGNKSGMAIAGLTLGIIGSLFNLIVIIISSKN